MDSVKTKGHSDSYRHISKKESNKAAARRSRLKKKNFENYNNEIRKNLEEINSRLINENNMLKNEVNRLNLILNSHRDCPMVVNEVREEMTERSKIDVSVEVNDDLSSISSNLIQPMALSVPPQRTTSNNRIYKIVSVDPLEVNSTHIDSTAYEKYRKGNRVQQRNLIIHESLPTTSHRSLDGDNSQVIDLSFNDNESSTAQPSHPSRRISDKEGADILLQAMSQLDDKRPNVKSSNSDYKESHSETSMSSEELIVHGSPGFVRVTSNSISVSQPMAKKMKRFVFGKSLGSTVTPNNTSSDTEF